MLERCWEMKDCGREKAGRNADELGVCPAYPDNGHSCWIVAGTFCGGTVQGTYARKTHFCNICEVYKLYSTSFGQRKDEFENECPGEFEACRDFIRHAVRNRPS